MIDLSDRLRTPDFPEVWKSIVDWLINNVGRAKLEKCNVMQGEGWMLIRVPEDGEYSFCYKLYIDDPNYEIMFKLAWS